MGVIRAEPARMTDWAARSSKLNSERLRILTLSSYASKPRPIPVRRSRTAAPTAAAVA